MQFDFGKNWSEFSKHALSAERVEQARRDFQVLMQDIPLAGKTFLDIGFGQGLSLLSAASMGASVIGCDINPKCAEVVKGNKHYYPELNDVSIPVVIGSILNESTVSELRRKAGNDKAFDVVHSWGVLHHTGDMRKALSNAATLVKPGGYFVVALYNRHWSSPAWLAIKWTYCKSPNWLQRLTVYAIYPVIWLAKLLVTGKNPKQKERGMDFFFDVVDWVGGYPYEYGSRQEVIDLIEPLGFTCDRFSSAIVPTGCNEFVLSRKA